MGKCVSLQGRKMPHSKLLSYFPFVYDGDVKLFAEVSTALHFSIKPCLTTSTKSKFVFLIAVSSNVYKVAP